MKSIIVDVREPGEYARGHVAGAVNMPPDLLLNFGVAPSPLDDIPTDAEIIVYCMTGSRSRVAQVILGRAGFSNVVNGINQDHVQAMLAKRS